MTIEIIFKQLNCIEMYLSALKSGSTPLPLSPKLYDTHPSATSAIPQSMDNLTIPLTFDGPAPSPQESHPLLSLHSKHAPINTTPYGQASSHIQSNDQPFHHWNIPTNDANSPMNTGTDMSPHTPNSTDKAFIDSSYLSTNNNPIKQMKPPVAYPQPHSHIN